MKQIAMPSSLFVTGTDTGVGKTVVASALIRLHAARGLRVTGMKPVASGAFHDGTRWRNDDVDALCAAANVELPARLVNPYLLKRATAPHLAAAEQGLAISPRHLQDCYRQLAAAADAVIVEGAGGFMVPLDERNNSDDLAVMLGLPVILVVGIRLGCINHALLTQQAIRNRGLPFAAWVANVIDPDEPLAPAMVDSLVRRIDAPLLGCLPWTPGMDGDMAARLLDLSPLAWPPYRMHSA